MKCLLCSFIAKSARGLSVHISKVHKINIKNYYDKYIKEDNEGICKTCKKPTRFYNLNKGYNKYCSIECSHNSKERNTKISNAKTEWHSKKENKEHMKNLLKNQWDKKDSNIRKALNSNSFKKKCSIRNFLRFKDKNFRKKHSDGLKKSWTKERKERHSKILKDQWDNSPKRKEELRYEMKTWRAAWLNSFISNPSKPQVKLFNMVKDIFGEYCSLNFSVGRYSVDIVIPHFNIAIEYDGSYWHKDHEKDLKRQREIEEEGWTFLRYRDYVPNENELLNDILSL
jgi:hypothetical protein